LTKADFQTIRLKIHRQKGPEKIQLQKKERLFFEVLESEKKEFQKIPKIFFSTFKSDAMDFQRTSKKNDTKGGKASMKTCAKVCEVEVCIPKKKCPPKCEPVCEPSCDSFPSEFRGRGRDRCRRQRSRSRSSSSSSSSDDLDVIEIPDRRRRRSCSRERFATPVAFPILTRIGATPVTAALTSGTAFVPGSTFTIGIPYFISTAALVPGLTVVMPDAFGNLVYSIITTPTTPILGAITFTVLVVIPTRRDDCDRRDRCDRDGYYGGFPGFPGSTFPGLTNGQFAPGAPVYLA
jgi:hypothetical protein